MANRVDKYLRGFDRSRKFVLRFREIYFDALRVGLVCKRIFLGMKRFIPAIRKLTAIAIFTRLALQVYLIWAAENYRLKTQHNSQVKVEFSGLLGGNT